MIENQQIFGLKDTSKWLLLLVSVIAISATNAKSTPYKDPNWTPFDNMVSALRGYNLITGSPISSEGDPGFAGQIFSPTKKSDEGMELQDGITASELFVCKRSMDTEVVTNIEDFRKTNSDTSGYGFDFQIGNEVDVAISGDVKVAEVSASATIPPAFTRSWGGSKDFKEMRNFFRKKHGIAVVSTGSCITYEIKLDDYLLPPFTNPFKKALIDLYEVRHKENEKVKAFKRFINEFGTHYITRAKMGAEWSFISKYDEDMRSNLKTSFLKSCTYVKGSKIFGIQIEQNSEECSINDESKLEKDFKNNLNTKIVTKGSRPSDINTWSQQDFTPVPLKFSLSPIVNLISSSKLKNLNFTTNSKIPIDKGILKWFLPMYQNICDVMKYDCEKPNMTGCGIDDKCPIDTICEDDRAKDTVCSEWTHWACSCEKRDSSERVKTCPYCKGESKEERKDLGCSPSWCKQKKVEKPKLVEIIPVWQKGWFVSFKINFGSNAGSEKYENIIDFTTTNDTEVLAIWYYDNGIYVQYRMDGEKTYEIIKNGIKKNKFIHIFIIQEHLQYNDYLFKIEVNGVIEFSKVNTKAEVFTGVKVKTGASDYEPVDAILKDMKYANLDNTRKAKDQIRP